MTRAAALVLAVTAFTFGCSDRASQPPAAALPTRKDKIVPATTKQLVTAVVDDWTTTKATLRLWQRGVTGWQPVGAAWPAVIGKAGSAWGIGIHGIGAPNREGPLKTEGDMKSPAGVFALRAAYGMAEAPPVGARLPYESTARGDWECIDDPASEHYAKIIDRKQVPSDWSSAEQLMRDDDLYTWIVDVGHNPERTAGKGSCIFLHVWSGPASSTAGCTAMDSKQLVQVIARLDPAANPMFVLLPRADYLALASDWGLPAL